MNAISSKLGGATQGDAAANLQADISGAGAADTSALADVNNSVNSSLNKDNLLEGLSAAMNDPAFRSAFAANNAGLLASMKAQLEGNPNAANLKDLSDTLKNKDKMLN